MSYTYAMSGDLGDVIYSLRVAHYHNNQDSVYYLVDRPYTKAWTKPRLKALQPLLEYQPYLKSAPHEEYKEEPTHNFCEFRSKGLPYGQNLADIHAAFVGVSLPPYNPWLTAPKNNSLEGKVVIHRSPRYHNAYFPWNEVINHYGDDLVAVGLEDEHKLFEEFLDTSVEFIPTEDYLHLASLLSGCKLFIGNQSSPMAIALGLGVPVVQETYIRQPDCLYKGANAYYSTDGYFVVEDQLIGKAGICLLKEDELPPKGWWYEKDGEVHKSSSLSMLRSKLGVSKMDILSYNTHRVRMEHPTYQGNQAHKVGGILLDSGYCKSVILRDSNESDKNYLTNSQKVVKEDSEEILSSEHIDGPTGATAVGAAECEYSGAIVAGLGGDLMGEDTKESNKLK